MPHKIHIVAFNVPYPADYGGVIDVFYKIKSLHEAGAEIYLHCFTYGREESCELEKLCKQVWYYPRLTGWRGISFSLPYIVYSRRSRLLLTRLVAIDAPILFEGVHSSYYLNHPALKNRQKAIRTHNVEWQYYTQLAKRETSFFKQLFFSIEANFLKKYESGLNTADVLVSLSTSDAAYFKQNYPETLIEFVPPFHPYNKVESIAGSGTYCLYHGNLSHPENEEAALYLIKEVFSKIGVPVIIAGKEPASAIKEASKSLHHCSLVVDPTEDEMQQLIANAHINILPTFQRTGMKLKLLYALFKGRHVLVNADILHGTGLDNLCHVANDAHTFAANIKALENVPFTENDIHKRSVFLQTHYSNAANAEKIITYLQG